MQPPRRFYTGQYIDASDTVNKWLNAEVLKVSMEEILIHFTGWSGKFDEWLPTNSHRVLFQWEFGKPIHLNNRIDVKHEVGGWLEARVIQIEGDKVRVHFEKYHPKYDCWVDLKDKSRVSEIGKHSKAFGIGKRKSKLTPAITEMILAKLKKEDRDFRDSLKTSHLMIKQMGSDGNCLFRSISDQLYGTQQHHAEIRSLCMDYIFSQQSFFENYVEGDFKQYVNNKRLDGVWGDDVELQAISEIYCRPIEIFVNGNTPIKTFHEENEQKKDPIRLAYHGRCHYNSIKAEDRLDKGIIPTKYGVYQKSFNQGMADFKLKRELYRKQFALTTGIDQTLNTVINSGEESKQREEQEKQQQSINEQVIKMVQTDVMLNQIEEAQLKEVQLREEEERIKEQLKQIEAKELEEIKRQSLRDVKLEEQWIQMFHQHGFSDEQIFMAISARGNDPDAILNYLYDNFD